MSQPEVAHVSLTDAILKGPPPPGNLAVPIFAHGSLEVEMYQPRETDTTNKIVRMLNLHQTPRPTISRSYQTQPEPRMNATGTPVYDIRPQFIGF